jgi:hypothetical protein
MTVAGQLWELPTLVRRTGATGSGLWPTPVASEARQGYQNRNNGKRGTQKSLTTVIQGGPSREVGGSLNPTWVELLMGWPKGWTSLEPLHGASEDLSGPLSGWANAEPWGPGWEDGIMRVAHGVPARVDRLRALGNGQVPQCAALAWRILMQQGTLRETVADPESDA